MSSKPAGRLGQVTLKFAGAGDGPLGDGRLGDDPVSKNLSAVARSGNSLFLACDEAAGIECLTRQADGTYGAHEHVSLAGFLDLPAGASQEMDIEGLAAVDGYLWVVGSHALKRRKLKQKDWRRPDLMQELGELVREPNRYILGRVPLRTGMPGAPTLAREAEGRSVAKLRMAGDRGGLARWLRKDRLLSPFSGLPAKENGLDIEGIAVAGERVWLGLRGPVIGGHAMVLELLLKEPRPGCLKPRRIGPGEQRYRRHMLDTGGLGIRDLRLDGEDLLLLVGPTMALEGTAHVLRWRRATLDEKEGLVSRERLELVADLPYLRDADHPEGLELWPEAGPGALLVVYDAPAGKRLEREGRTVQADILLPTPD
jgi:hypothetical protein